MASSPGSVVRDDRTLVTADLSRFNAMKRLTDLVAVGLTLPLTGPLMVAIGAAVRVLDGHGALFRQEREGLGGRPFHALKFRTMSEARDDTGALLPDRQRLTRTGRALRRSSLDELPQLLNVLKGDMSLVGPRPLYVRYSRFYTARERRRQLVRPGITGLAQTSGRNAVGWTDRLALDAEYVERHSLRLDLVLLARTVVKAVTGAGVDVIAGDSGDPLDVERSYPRTESVALRRLYRGDLQTRVRWLGDDRTRRHMSLVGEVGIGPTERWYERVCADERRMDFAAYDPGTGRLLAMAGLTGLHEGAAEYYVFVDPDGTGRGVGGVTTNLVLTWAGRSGFAERVWLTVEASNVRAVSIYRGRGFEVTSTAGDDRLVMTRDVRPAP